MVETRRFILLCFTLCAAALSGCQANDRADTPRVEEPPAPATVDTAPLSVIDIARLHYEQVPDSVLLRGGACPFECCMYREWRAETAIPVMREPSPDAPPAFEIAAGTHFLADTGFVHITGPGIVVVLDTVFIDPGRRLLFAPGDTLVVLDYEGEGHWNLWRRGRVFESVEGFWGAEIDSPRGAYLGDYQKQWWVRARMNDGRLGWFRADSTFRVSGSDACG